jgi:tetratricopeptide (TPR) repeat protein
MNEKKYCQSCGGERPPTAKFCRHCGAQVAQRPATTGNMYVDECMQFFEEVKEERRWPDVPGAKAVVDVGNAVTLANSINETKAQEALRLADELRKKYPDFYFPYLWLASIYRKKAQYDGARNVLIEGLRLSRNKNTLCNALGQTEYEAGNLPGAVMWWIRCTLTQVHDKTANQKEFAPAQDLSYVAAELGLPEAREHLRQWADRHGGSGIRRTAEAAQKLYAATRSQGTDSMKRAIERLDKECLS